MIRFVIVNYGLKTSECDQYFWSSKRSAWQAYINLATRYKKREEADRVAFGMTTKNLSKNLGSIAVEPASKFEGGMTWRKRDPGDNCYVCHKPLILRDVYVCNRTCMGFRPRHHRHATCGNCGFMANLLPMHSII